MFHPNPGGPKLVSSSEEERAVGREERGEGKAKRGLEWRDGSQVAARGKE